MTKYPKKSEIRMTNPPKSDFPNTIGQRSTNSRFGFRHSLGTWVFRHSSLLFLTLLLGCRTGTESHSTNETSCIASSRSKNPVWRCVHLSVSSDAQADALIGQLPRLADVGVN